MRSHLYGFVHLFILLAALFGPSALWAQEYGFYTNDYIKTTDTLNIRSGAGLHYSSLTTASKGTVGQIVGGPTLNNGYYWWRVNYPVLKVTGWSVQDYLTLYNPRATESWLGTQVQVKGTGSVGLRLRSGAGLNFSSLTTLSEGTVAAVIAGPVQKDAYVWWKLYVLPGGMEGWGVQRFLAPYIPPSDKTRPVISLLGSATVSVTYGASYKDAGATATDNVDGTITAHIVTTGLPIPTHSPGTYFVRYNVKDAAGNAADEVVRRVTVQEPPAPPPTSMHLFKDAIAPGWNNWSWNANVFSSATVVYQGTHGLGVGYTAPWGGLYLQRAPVSTSGLVTLRFAVYGPDTGGQTPFVALVDESGNALQWLSIVNYVPGNMLKASTWYSVVIPLADLKAQNRMISGFSVTSPTAPTGLFLDEIVLSTVSGSTFAPPSTTNPPPNAPATLFGDVFGSGWTTSWSWGTLHAITSSYRFAGTAGLAVTYANPWAGFVLRANSFSTSGYNTLTFAIHGAEGGGQDITVSLSDTNGALSSGVPLGSYLVGGVLTPYTWHEVRIPLTDLKGLNRTITGVTFQSATATTVTLDEIRFVSTTQPDTGVCNE